MKLNEQGSTVWLIQGFKERTSDTAGISVGGGGSGRLTSALHLNSGNGKREKKTGKKKKKQASRMNSLLQDQNQNSDSTFISSTRWNSLTSASFKRRMKLSTKAWGGSWGDITTWKNHHILSILDPQTDKWTRWFMLEEDWEKMKWNERGRQTSQQQAKHAKLHSDQWSEGWIIETHHNLGEIASSVSQRQNERNP